jgi:hypothetical protein
MLVHDAFLSDVAATGNLLVRLMRTVDAHEGGIAGFGILTVIGTVGSIRTAGL